MLSIKNSFILTAVLFVFPPCWAADQIDQLIELGKKAPPVQYETIGSGYIESAKEPIDVLRNKVWQKSGYSKITDAANKPVVVTRPDGIYIYDPKMDKYIKHARPDGPPEKAPYLFLGRDKNSTLTIVGDEIVDGKECTIVNNERAINGEMVTTKTWVWKKYGFFVRIEVKSKMGPNTVTQRIDYKNFIFGDIPDSVFDIPKEKVIEQP